MPGWIRVKDKMLRLLRSKYIKCDYLHERKKEELVLRNRFHKEPVNKENVVRPDQAGTKENPDYVVNIAGKIYKNWV